MAELTKKERERMLARAERLKPKPVLLPSGAWRCQVMVGGRRHSLVAETPEKAWAMAIDLKEGHAAKSKPREDLTVGEAVDRYIESKDAVLSSATIAGYQRVKNNALTPLLKVRLHDLTQEEVQRWANALAKNKAPKTIRNAHGLLSSVVGAYRPDFVLRTTLPQKKRYDVAVPSEDDVSKIMAAVRGTENEISILLAVWLGLRMSEILGLRWEDIDGDILRIRRAKVDEGEKTTKTYSSQRNLRLPSYLRQLLRDAPHKSDYIVPISRRALYCRFQVICRRAGVQHYRFHDLRHINASVMLAIGVPNKYAQQRLGHATDNMLKTVYQHTMSADEIAVADKVDAKFEQMLEIAHGIAHEKNKTLEPQAL